MTKSDRLVTGSLLLLLFLVALSNSLTYPPIAGFDAEQHIGHAQALIDTGGFGGESYTPPGFYLLAGSATKFGAAIGLDEPLRLAQLLNAVVVLLTGILVVALARLLFPRRPVLHWAALAFFVCCPVVLKTAAMFHPQTLAALLMTLAFVLCARMIVHRRYGFVEWAALAATLAAAQLVRSVAIWAVAIVVMVLIVAAAARPEHRRAITKPLAIALAAVVLVPLPWYVYLQSKGSNPIFGRGMSVLRTEGYLPPTFYVSPGLPELITEPHRGSFSPRFLPILYTDTWGDYFGIWSWGGPLRSELTPDVNRRLVVQNLAGLPLSVVGLAGWFAVACLTRAHWRRTPERVLLAVGPLAAMSAVLYYATRAGTHDGDTVKAMFLLPAVPFWALSFGFAADVLFARGRRVAVPAFTLLVICALVCLSFSAFALAS